MDAAIARDSLAAWKSFRTLGGIEVGGRDADFEAKLKQLLAPLAPDLETALEACSTDDLVRALFQVVSPFAEMFRNIVAFFQTAGANQGREQWMIKIEEDHLDLADFEAFLENWASVEKLLDIPAIDFRGAWALNDATDGLPLRERPLLGFHSDDRSPTGDPVIDAWLAAYAKGDYRPFPAVLHPDVVPAELADAAGICWAAVERIRSIWGSRERMDAAYRAWDGRTKLLPIVEADALDPGTIAQNETDFWLGSSLVILGRALRASSLDLYTLGVRLTDAYAKFGRREIGFEADISLLERILSLPAWRRRHELYAVWIATEIVAGLPDHDVELHHEDGRIVFAFRETVVATIRTAFPVMRLFAERRVPLDSPIGEGRTANVQPDYSLWSGPEASDRCKLVVEVKHYKRAARTRFSAVLVDYARAHPDAVIALVNHGPTGDMIDGVENHIVKRCRQFGELTASNRSQRDAFRKLVRDIVGAPPSAGATSTTSGSVALLIDVSSSMRAILASPVFASWLNRSGIGGAGLIALADTQIRQRCASDQALAAATGFTGASSTALIGPVAELLGDFEQVMVATDWDGVSELAQFGDRLISKLEQANGLWIATVTR
jgi:hypothetical protein